MASKRWGILAGGALAGMLLLGTAGLVAAQDPTASPSPAWGPGMMGGAGTMGGAGMMDGAGMMGGAGGMMGGQSGPGTMTPEQLEWMDALHDQVIEDGACDPAQMELLHAQHHSNG